MNQAALESNSITSGVNESRFLVNLELRLEEGAADMGLTVATGHEWLIAAPLEFMMKTGQPVSLSISSMDLTRTSSSCCGVIAIGFSCR